MPDVSQVHANIDALIVDFAKVLRDTSWSRVVGALQDVRPGLTKEQLYAAVFPDFVDYERGIGSEQSFWGPVAKKLGLESTPGAATLLAQRYLNVLCGHNVETVALFEKVRRSGAVKRMVLLSNASVEIADAARTDPRLVPLFDNMLFSVDLGERKPHPTTFTAAVEACGVPIERCLFVDDQSQNVAGAQAVGLRAVRYTGAAQLAHDLEHFGLL